MENRRVGSRRKAESTATGAGSQAALLSGFPQESVFSIPLLRKHRHLHSEDHRFCCFLQPPRRRQKDLLQWFSICLLAGAVGPFGI